MTPLDITDARPASTPGRGFRLGRLVVRYIRSLEPTGWGHNEGDVTTATLFAFDVLHPNLGERFGRATGVRFVLRRHSLWLLW
jgi:hypothetical protein